MRPCEPNRPENAGYEGVVASLLLHGLFLFALMTIAPKLLPSLPPEDPIAVEIIAPPPPPLPPPTVAQKAPAEPVAASEPAKDTPPKPEASPETKPPDDGMIRSNQIYSGKVLARAGNEEALHDYRNLTGDEQREQLCSLEALEQIAAWNDAYKPERMVTYTFEEVRYEGNHMIADGAVFWSHDNWHRVKFDCELSDDQSTVLNLAFAVGTIVPKSDWEDYYLTQYK